MSEIAAILRQEPYPLPDGWVWVTLGELAEIRNGVTKGRDLSCFETIDVPYLRVANVQNGYLNLDEVKSIRIKTNELEKYRLCPNDILFTEGGDRDKLGRGAVWQGEITNCVHQNHIHCARLRQTNVEPKWISLASQLTYARDYFWRTASQTVNLASLNATSLKSLPIPLPPLSEQKLILEKIDYALDYIQSARSALDRIPALLKAFRQAVLAAAFRGELSERQPGDEPAQRLLERIRAERRSKWEAGLRAKGKDPAQAVYVEPGEVDAEGLPALPEEWVWTTIGIIGEVSGGLTKNANRDKYPLKRPYITVANVYADELQLDEVGVIGVHETEIARVLLQTGDLLIVEGNGSIDQIGRAAVWDGSIEGCLHQNHIIKVRFQNTDFSRYVLLWLQSPTGRDAIARVASSTSGLFTLSLSKVENLPIPVCSQDEQNRLINKVGQLFENAMVAHIAMDRSLKHLGALEQAVLGKAFRGGL